MTIEIDLGDGSLDRIGEILVRAHASAFVTGYLAGQHSEQYIDATAELFHQVSSNQYPEPLSEAANPPASEDLFDGDCDDLPASFSAGCACMEPI